MKSFEPTPTAPSPPAPAPMDRSPARALSEMAGTVPEYEPSVHRFDWKLGERRRATIPLSIVDGIGLSDRDRVVEMSQITIAENCRAMRLARRGNDIPYDRLMTAGLRAAIRKVGDMEGADLGDRELDDWLGKIGIQGHIFLAGLLEMLSGPQKAAVDLFEASRRIDLARRRYTYKIPASQVPPKRWSARTGLDGRLVDGVWTVGGQPATEAQQPVLERDLTFTMQQITIEQESSVADLVDDPDDVHATRIMEVMLSLVDIGGVAFGNSAGELARKLAWLEDIGPRARMLVTGTYARLHEVDKVELARFLDDSVPIE